MYAEGIHIFQHEGLPLTIIAVSFLLFLSYFDLSLYYFRLVINSLAAMILDKRSWKRYCRMKMVEVIVLSFA
jgi:hypothetical protein